jgi:hypothetical protein
MMEDIRDIKGPVPLPSDWWWLWVVLGVIVAGAVAFWLWRRREHPVSGETPVLLTPFEVAMDSLRRLREVSLPVEEFYTRLSDIVRQYIEARFGLRAPERTTEEFLAEATLPRDSMALLGEFLREADLVKFARYRPGNEDMDRAFDAAETFIRRSDIPVATPAVNGRGKDAAPTTTTAPV